MSWKTTAMTAYLSWKTTHSRQKVLYVCVFEPVPKDHLSWETTFMANGVVFQDRFYCIRQVQIYAWYMLTKGQFIDSTYG